MTLDDLREALLRRGFAGLTIWPATDGRFQANLKIGDGWQCFTADDPLDALRGAIRAPVVSDMSTDNTGETDIFG